jgi:hypothetical protein
MRNCFHVKQTVERYSMQDGKLPSGMVLSLLSTREEVPSSTANEREQWGPKQTWNKGIGLPLWHPLRPLLRLAAVPAALCSGRIALFDDGW